MEIDRYLFRYLLYLFRYLLIKIIKFLKNKSPFSNNFIFEFFEKDKPTDVKYMIYFRLN